MCPFFKGAFYPFPKVSFPFSKGKLVGLFDKKGQFQCSKGNSLSQRYFLFFKGASTSTVAMFLCFEPKYKSNQSFQQDFL